MIALFAAPCCSYIFLIIPFFPEINIFEQHNQLGEFILLFLASACHHLFKTIQADKWHTMCAMTLKLNIEFEAISTLFKDNSLGEKEKKALHLLSSGKANEVGTSEFNGSLVNVINHLLKKLLARSTVTTDLVNIIDHLLKNITWKDEGDRSNKDKPTNVSKDEEERPWTSHVGVPDGHIVKVEVVEDDHGGIYCREVITVEETMESAGDSHVNRDSEGTAKGNRAKRSREGHVQTGTPEKKKGRGEKKIRGKRNQRESKHRGEKPLQEEESLTCVNLKRNVPCVRHGEKKHEENPTSRFRCRHDKCGKTFTKPEELANHNQVHDLGPYSTRVTTFRALDLSTLPAHSLSNEEFQNYEGQWVLPRSGDSR